MDTYEESEEDETFEAFDSQLLDLVETVGVIVGRVIYCSEDGAVSVFFFNSFILATGDLDLLEILFISLVVVLLIWLIKSSEHSNG